MTTHAIEWARPPRHSTAFLLIVALHALVIYGFLRVFVPPRVQAPVPPVITGHFFDPERQTPSSGPRGPNFTPTHGSVDPLKDLPVPQFNWGITDPSSAASSASSDTSAGAGPTVPLSYVVTRPIDEYYPSQAIRLSEEGVSTLQVCVGADGRLAGAPTLQTGSGYPLLDTAALKWAREALRFSPAQQDGKAVPACKGFRVTFRLRT